jgi:hypothetical protein
VLHVDATHGIVQSDIRGRYSGGGLIVNIQNLTTSLQFIAAALAVPAGAAGLYSAYHNYFSPEVLCQELRNSTLVTLEKNIPTEAKRTLLRTEAAQFESKCGEVEPETNMVFKVALQELEKPAPPRGSQRAAGQQQQRPVAPANLGAPQVGAPQVGAPQAVAPQAVAPQTAAPQATAPQATAGATASLAPSAPPASWAAPPAPAVVGSPGPALSAAAAQPAPTRGTLAPGPAAVASPTPAVAPAGTAGAPAGPAVASLGSLTRFMRPVRGWVAIEVRKPGKATEAFFSGYPVDGQSLPRPGIVLTAMAFRPIWSEPQGQGPIDPTRLQGRVKVGECVRVITTAASLGRQWAEVEPAACP